MLSYLMSIFLQNILIFTKYTHMKWHMSNYSWVVLDATVHWVSVPTNRFVGLTSTCRKPEMKDDTASLRVKWGQHIESQSRCWLSRPKLKLKINSYPNLSRCWVDTDPIYWEKFVIYIYIYSMVQRLHEGPSLPSNEDLLINLVALIHYWQSEKCQLVHRLKKHIDLN